jgi:hypothetical protein
MGNALRNKGDLEGAIAAYQQALRIDPKQPHALWALPQAQRLRELLPRLPDVLAGKDRPRGPAEACEFAHLCALPSQKRYAAAARHCADAFAEGPKLVADLQAAHRYRAATYAALAGCAKGEDAAKGDAKENQRLREQALAWLQADLALRRRQAASADAAQRRTAAATLTSWLNDKAFAGVRAGPDRARVTAQERSAWDALWSEVKATIALAQKSPGR